METKTIEGWHMPAEENSVMRKIGSIRARSAEPFLIDDYQRGMSDYALANCKNFRTAIDIGAHIGIWAIRFAKLFQEVHAFEINPVVLPCLHANILDRNIQNIKVYEYGLGSISQKVELSANKSKSMGVHVASLDVGNISVHPLDQLNLTNVDLIKMDVEGFESQVILGARETILANRPTIVLEDRAELHEKFGGPTPSSILLELGMTEIIRFRKDVIFGFSQQ